MHIKVPLKKRLVYHMQSSQSKSTDFEKICPTSKRRHGQPRPRVLVGVGLISSSTRSVLVIGHQ